MGVSCLGSSSSYDYAWNDKRATVPTEGNPNPAIYVITRFREIERLDYKLLLVEINYPSCNNYEGNKILVYENMTISRLQKLKLVDPHFSSDHPEKSPIARFKPTDSGWQMAETFMKAIIDEIIV
jgi:hypothetical protein